MNKCMNYISSVVVKARVASITVRGKITIHCKLTEIILFSGRLCFPQRVALLKSMLNFLKKAIPDPSFSDSIRHCKSGFAVRLIKRFIQMLGLKSPKKIILGIEE